jgi:hypothetical protein
VARGVYRPADFPHLKPTADSSPEMIDSSPFSKSFSVTSILLLEKNFSHSGTFWRFPALQVMSKTWSAMKP